MEAIAAVVIGGTSLSGGKGTILGTVIGALIMSVLTNGLQILSVPQEWQTVVVERLSYWQFTQMCYETKSKELTAILF